MQAPGASSPTPRRGPPSAAGEIDLTVNGRRLAWCRSRRPRACRPGAGGLQVLRYAAWYRADGAGGVGGLGPRLAVNVSTYAGPASAGTSWWCAPRAGRG